MTANPATKPLGIKAYGHVPHLPGSRVGPGDHRCNEGHAVIATQKKRDQHDVVSVTVKLDGSCVAVARINGVIVPLIRAGWPAFNSDREQHQLFAAWVMAQQNRFLQLLRDGERVVGEWLAQAHGTRYCLPHEPFVAFDLMVGTERLPTGETRGRCIEFGFATPHLLHSGEPISVAAILLQLLTPHHGELDPVEGAVWRVERKGSFDFIAKYVHPSKVDGAYLPEYTGGAAVWNWRPK